MRPVREAAGRAQHWVRAQSLPHGYGQGTLGAILRAEADGRLYGLTAGHVLGEDDRARRDDACRLQVPGGSAVDGRLVDWMPWFGRHRPECPVDAGLLALATPAVESLVDQIAWPLGWADPEPDVGLRVLARHHRLEGRLRERRTVWMEAGAGELRYRIIDACILQVEGGTLPGDSGAPVWNERDELVGILAGSAPQGLAGNTVVTPIRAILQWSRAQPVLRKDALRAEDRGAPLPRPAVPAAAHAALAAAVAPAVAQGDAVDTLARTMWGEARGEPQPRRAMAAVGHVVLNRVIAGRWWGRDVVAVCLRHRQFSCWNAGDPNRPKLDAVTAADAMFRLALEVAGGLLEQAPDDPARIRDDPTGGATHYHAARMPRPPSWAIGRTPQAAIGNHLFFRDVA